MRWEDCFQGQSTTLTQGFLQPTPDMVVLFSPIGWTHSPLLSNPFCSHKPISRSQYQKQHHETERFMTHMHHWLLNNELTDYKVIVFLIWNQLHVWREHNLGLCTIGENPWVFHNHFSAECILFLSGVELAVVVGVQLLQTFNWVEGLWWL